MTWVLDASVLVAYLLGRAEERERAAVTGDAHCPAFADVEVTHVLRGLVRGSKLTLEAAETARQELGQLAVRRHPNAALLGGAWHLRETCTTYDGLYVALAQGLSGTLVTRDERLARGVAGLVDLA